MSDPAAPDTSLRDALSAHFAPDDIEWRIGQAGKKDDGSIWAKAFAYITNRAIQQRLDDVVGPGQWRNEEPRIVQIADADGKPVTAFLCGLSLKINGEWVTKWDGSEPSDMEPVKGGLSGSMKRAAVQWGIGRYLYDLPEGWAKVGPNGRHFASVNIKGPGGQKQQATFKWDPPDLPKWALPQGAENGVQAHAPKAEESRPVLESAAARGDGPSAPTEKQVAFFQKLAESSVFTDEERRRALDWLATKATRQTIKDQIDWLKNQVEKRSGRAAHATEG